MKYNIVWSYEDRQYHLRKFGEHDNVLSFGLDRDTAIRVLATLRELDDTGQQGIIEQYRKLAFENNDSR